jgi:hypothetical protein
MICKFKKEVLILQMLYVQLETGFKHQNRKASMLR